MVAPDRRHNIKILCINYYEYLKFNRVKTSSEIKDVPITLSNLPPAPLVDVQKS